MPVLEVSASSNHLRLEVRAANEGMILVVTSEKPHDWPLEFLTNRTEGLGVELVQKNIAAVNVDIHQKVEILLA